jgi:predicted nucleotidyltransferase component of viral defense system
MLDWYTLMYTMLTQDQAQKFAFEQQTVVDNILKEHLQMVPLDILFNSPFEDRLVFKGGSALKLVYGSSRFSEDLDFSLLGEVNFTDFSQAVQKIEKFIPGAKIKDIHDKYYSLYAKVVINIAFRPIPIGIKIEVNKNSHDFDQSIALIKSSFNNLEVIGRVYTLESILKDKIRIIEKPERREPRDLFDAWYISQKLGRNLVIKDEYKYSQKELMDSLNHFLPKNQRKVIELFTKK